MNENVNITFSSVQLGVGIALGFIFSILAFIYLLLLPSRETIRQISDYMEQEYHPKRINVQGVDCVVINNNAITCDWHNAQAIP